MKRNRSIENRYTLGGATFPFLFKNPPCNVFLIGGAGRGKSNKKTKKTENRQLHVTPFHVHIREEGYIYRKAPAMISDTL